jgi:hypothetical protein
MRNLITCLGEILIDFLPIEEGGARPASACTPAARP